MNETIRTLIFVLAGVIALVIAWIAKPAGIRHTRVDDTGERFFAQFDPLEARSMEIVTFNEASGERRPFKVAQVSSLWSIPSRENYPADAQDRLAKAAASVMDLTKGTVVSDSPADHELYGVVDPGTGTAVNGVGTRVTLKDLGDNTLVDFVIGKAVKDSENLHYVREPNRDRVYTAKVATDQLSTKFEDWIERDLLKLDAMQITSVTINNYSIDELNQRINRGDTLVLTSKEDNTWSLAGPPELKPEEELNAEKLNAMRTALDDLKIVDVHRKPEGLAKQLQGEGEMKIDSAARTSLAGAGYYIVGNQLLSNEGETSIKTRDGAHYALRFGEVVNFDAGSSDASSGDDSMANQPGTSAGRYLFVTADFDESVLEKPVYEPVPELPATQPTTQGGSVVEGSAATQPDPALQAHRQSIIDANELKRTDYEKKVSDAQQKVKDLNKRFAEWYYVVGDDVYQKIKMTRADVVKSKAQATTPAAPPTPNPFPNP